MCTHLDAFRFFTDDARPLNAEILDRDRQLDREQPGCLHATMDLYRIAFRLLPFVETVLSGPAVVVAAGELTPEWLGC